MSEFLTVARIETRIILSSKLALFWTFAFPVLLLVAQTRLQDGPAAELRIDALQHVAGVLAIVVTSTVLIGFAAPIMQARENGVLASCVLWPASPAVLLAAMAAARLLVVLLASLVVLGVARWGLAIDLPADIVPLIGCIVFGATCMLGFGIAAGSRISTTQSAVALCNLLYFAMIFTGEVFFNAKLLGQPAAKLMAWLPVNALVHSFLAALQSDAIIPWQPLAALALCGTVSVLAATRLFVWAPSRRLRPG